MSNNNIINDKKNALLAYKEKILEDIKCCEKDIEDFRANHRNNNYFDKDFSSDEDDLISILDTGPSIKDLNLQQVRLQTCLQATQELTNLTILQSEINVLVEEPVFEGEPPVKEPGIWREVTAECRADLVPFSITFFVHTPSRKFASSSYRGLQVVLIKASHEVELNKSVLHTLSRPSDAVEVIRSYAVAHRSRRTTLARLANKYATSLFMEPHPEGGFVLKCANLLEIWWRLENKWSQVAPFHHRMKFDLEYMDESYIKIITQSHKQLLDPSIQTDERTLLLAKIISTCLEARGPTDPQETIESDLESKTTDNDPKDDLKKKDNEVMAPPKSLPKKIKAKNKENAKNLPNLAQKRSLTASDSAKIDGAKKIKTNDEYANFKNDLKESGNTVNNDGNKHVKDGNTNTRDGKAKKSTATTKNSTVATSKASDLNENIVASTKNSNSDRNNDIAAKTVTSNSEAKQISQNVEANSKNKTEKDKTKNVPPLKNFKESTAGMPEKSTNNDDPNAKSKELKDKAKLTKNLKESIDPRKTVVKDKNTEETTAKTKTAKDKNSTKNFANPKYIANSADGDKNIDRNNINVEANAKDEVAKGKNKVKSIVNTKKTTDSTNTVDVPDANAKNVKTKSNSAAKTKISAKNDKALDTIPTTVAKSNNLADKNIKNPENATSNTKNSDNANTKKTTDSTNTVDVPNANAKNVKTKSNSAAKTKTSAKNDKALDTIPTTVAKSKNLADKNIKNPENATANTKNSDNATTKIKHNIISLDTQDPANIMTENKNIGENKDKTLKKVTEKQISSKIKDKIIDRQDFGVNNKKTHTNRETQKEKLISGNTANVILKNNNKLTKTIHKNSLKMQNVLKNGSINKIFKAGNIDMENGGKSSKIPQKILSPISERALKLNPLRISPRNLPSKFKTQMLNKHSIMKTTTSIPRLLKKPTPK